MKRRQPVDPLRHSLTEELRQLRRGHGQMTTRLGELPWLVDTLGHGNLERAADQLAHLRHTDGIDPQSDIGTLFWLIERGVTHPDSSLEHRLNAYSQQYRCDARTALRRSDRAIQQLAGLLRDQAEAGRPVGMFWMFQSGDTATAVIDLMLSYESFRPPIVQVNGQEHDIGDFVIHRDNTDPSRYRGRIILDNLPLDLTTGDYEPCLRIRVIWDMPIWPVWQLTGWIADPRFAVRMQTYRERAAEVGFVRTVGLKRAGEPHRDHANDRRQR